MTEFIAILITFLIIGLNFCIAVYFREYAMLIYNSSIVIFLAGVLFWFWRKFGIKKYKMNIKKIKYSEDFKEKYKYISSVHDNRFKVRKILINVCTIGSALMFLLLIIVKEKIEIPENVYDFAFLSVFCIILISFIKRKQFVKEYKKYKEEIFPDIIKTFSEDMLYSSGEYYNGDIRTWYYAAGFDNGKMGYFKTNDYIKCLKEDMKIEIANVWIPEGNSDSVDVIFYGIFAHADIVKNIEKFISISQNKVLKRKNKIDMDNSDFEEIFDIYSRDKVYAMRILTSDVMMLLRDFYLKFEIEFEIVLRGNKIFTRFYTGKIFGEGMFEDPLNKKTLYIYYCIINFIIDLTKGVNKALEEI